MKCKITERCECGAKGASWDSNDFNEDMETFWYCNSCRKKQTEENKRQIEEYKKKK